MIKVGIIVVSYSRLEINFNLRLYYVYFSILKIDSNLNFAGFYSGYMPQNIVKMGSTLGIIILGEKI